MKPVESTNRTTCRAVPRPLRAHLLNGTSSLALSLASMIVALGVCPSAQAQSTVSPQQTTTFTLNAGSNPIIFDANTNIDTSATPGATAVSGAAGTTWTVTNQGSLKGNGIGVAFFGAGSVTNGGTISSTGSGAVAAISIGNGGTVTNQAGRTISSVSGNGISISGAAGTVTNAGTITGGGATAVTMDAGGNVTNQDGGTISGSIGVAFTGSAAGSIINAGTIDGTFGAGISGLISSVTNQAGGTISGAQTGIDVVALAPNILNNPTINNASGATISGGSNGIVLGVSGTVINAGTITGSAHSIVFNGAGANTLTLQTGSVLNGDANGSGTSTNNKLILEGTGTASNNFNNFNSLEVATGSSWALNGNANVGAVAINGGRLEVNGSLLGGGGGGAGDVAVNNNGQLSGVGSVQKNINVMNGGILAPGPASGTATGTLRVVGADVSFATNSVFQVTANGNGTASKLAVEFGGTANLTNGSVRVLAGGTFAPSTQYTILTAAGGLGGTTFAGINANLAFLTPSLSYDANNVFLTLACNNPAACAVGGGGGGGGGGTVFGFATVAQTPNQAAVATALDQGPTTNPLIAALLIKPRTARGRPSMRCRARFTAACTMCRPKRRSSSAARCSRACGRPHMPIRPANWARSALPARNWLMHRRQRRVVRACR